MFSKWVCNICKREGIIIIIPSVVSLMTKAEILLRIDGIKWVAAAKKKKAKAEADAAAELEAENEWSKKVR